MGWFKKIVNKVTDDILGVDPNGGGIYGFFDNALGIDPNGGGVFSFLKKVGVNVDANDFYKALNDAVSKGLEYAIVYVTKVPVKINVSLFKNPAPLQGKSVNEQFNRLVSSDTFNEQFYRLIHKDVDAEIKAGKMPSGIYHYINYGYAEGRVTSLQFNESFYRLIHKDVDAAIKAGTQSSALQHYIIHGYSEGRVTNLSFDEQYYRSTNHDVDAEIKAGKMPSAIYHYMNHGYAEGRVAQFNVLNSNDSLWGTSNSDILKGSNGNNFLGGGSGNDKLIGLDGNDTLVGGLGNDILDGGNGIDTAVYTGKSNEYHVVFYSDFTHVSDTASNRDDTDTLLSNVENVQFSDKALSLAQIRDMGARFSGLDGNDVVTGGKGNDIDIRGNAGHDKLYGLQGNDNLFGNDGNDVLVGGVGADNLTGGAGADRFHYPIFTDSVLANLDRITDFTPTEGDRIALKSLPSSIFNGSVFSNSTLSGAISAAYADVNPNLAGNQALGANQAVFFGWNGGKYVSVNDGLAPFNANTDLVINVTGMTGTMATGALTPTNYFGV